MVALKAGEVERFLARPKSEHAVVLVYGPDAGLVAERCDALAARQLGIPADPMGLVRLEGDEIASDPDRLLDEAHTIPLFGGDRVIRLRLGSRSVQGPVQRLLEGPRPEALVLIEGGDLKRSHPVRTLCEKSPSAVTLPCYPDAAADVARLVEQELGAAGFSVTADARALLIGLLGGDRLASRQELRKLALYAHGQDRIEHADVEAAIADSTTSAVDKIVDAAFAGDPAETDLQMHLAVRAGIAPGTIILAALRQALQLARMKADAGGSRGAAEAAMRHLPFPKKAALERALGRWSQGELDRAVQLLADATFESRKRFDLAGSVVGRALVVVAAQAGRRGRTDA